MRGSVVSVNRGAVQVLHWRGRDYETGFIKTPVDEPVPVGPLGLEGDEQANLTAHGGLHKAVYLYPREHYDAWMRELALSELPAGSFGENLTVTGVDEGELQLGDVLQVGGLQLLATEPRLPCMKLSVRFAREDMRERFSASRRSGAYFSVEAEGIVTAGDAIERIHVSASGWSVQAAFEVLTNMSADLDRVGSLSEVPWLSDRVRGKLLARLSP
ncbi:MAG: MOSC domain-containing protein [Gemmatimonadota bacterium]